MIYKEFRDGFNSHATNTTKYSIILHTIILLPIDTLLDKQEYTYPIGSGHKSKDMIINEAIFIEKLNKLYSPNNTKKIIAKYRTVSVVLYNSRILMD